MSRTVQALMICVASLLGGLTLAWARGWPVAPSRVTAIPAAESAASCEASAEASAEAGAEAGAEPGAPGIRWISQEEASARVGDPNVAFVDCRTRDLFEKGHIAGALHVPAEEAALTPKALEALHAATTIITYCDADTACERSVRMASVFTRSGLADVRVLQGGIPAWLAHGFPAQSGTCRLCQDHGLTR